MELSINTSENISVIEHPIINHNLTILRDKGTSSEFFRVAAKKVAGVLLINALNNLPTIKANVITPLTATESSVIDPKSEIIFAPILRAGLIFSDVASDLIPQARVHHVGLYRDEKTLNPVAYYNNLPESFTNPDNTFIYLLDPMLATGGSAVASIRLFTNLKIPQKNIRFVSLISAPEGIVRLHSEYPDIKIVTAYIDSHLNEFGYIVPGLGDAGDRTFNTTY